MFFFFFFFKSKIRCLDLFMDYRTDSAFLSSFVFVSRFTSPDCSLDEYVPFSWILQLLPFSSPGSWVAVVFS